MCVVPKNPKDSSLATRGLGIATGGIGRIPGLISGADKDFGGAAASLLTGGVSDSLGAATDLVGGQQDAIAKGFTGPASTLGTPGAGEVVEKSRAALPNIQDEKERRARAAQMLRSLSGRGRAASFLTGPAGATGARAQPMASGY